MKHKNQHDGFFINETLNIESAIDNQFLERSLPTRIYQDEEMRIWEYAVANNLDASFAENFKENIEEKPVRFPNLNRIKAKDFMPDTILDASILLLMLGIVIALAILGQKTI